MHNCRIRWNNHNFGINLCIRLLLQHKLVAQLKLSFILMVLEVLRYGDDDIVFSLLLSIQNRLTLPRWPSPASDLHSHQVGLRKKRVLTKSKCEVVWNLKLKGADTTRYLTMIPKEPLHGSGIHATFSATLQAHFPRHLPDSDTRFSYLLFLPSPLLLLGLEKNKKNNEKKKRRKKVRWAVGRLRSRGQRIPLTGRSPTPSVEMVSSRKRRSSPFFAMLRFRSSCSPIPENSMNIPVLV